MFDSVLESIQQYGPFSSQELLLLESKLKNKLLKKGAYLIKEDNICQAFYFLKTGRCRHFFTKTSSVIMVTHSIPLVAIPVLLFGFWGLTIG